MVNIFQIIGFSSDENLLPKSLCGHLLIIKSFAPPSTPACIELFHCGSQQTLTSVMGRDGLSVSRSVNRISSMLFIVY
jgi:hypothetical protein